VKEVKASTVLWAAALLLAPVIHAGVIYNNGAPAATDNNFGNEMTHWIEADNFSLAATDTIRGVEFWELNREDLPGDYNGSIDWFIYSDNSGSPGTVLASGNVAPTRTATGVVLQSVFTEFDMKFSIPDFVATGGTTYWLGLHNGSTATDTTNEQFFWEVGNAGVPPANHDFPLDTPGATWSESFNEFAFNLSNTAFVTATPEPGTILLLGCGLAAFAIRRKR